MHVTAVLELRSAHKSMDKFLTDVRIKKNSIAYLQQQLTEDLKVSIVVSTIVANAITTAPTGTSRWT